MQKAVFDEVAGSYDLERDLGSHREFSTSVLRRSGKNPSR